MIGSPVPKPKTTGNGIRQYTEKDIENLKAVYNLVKVRGFKIAAAKKMLATNKEGVEKSARVIEGLMKVRDAETGHEMFIDTSSKKLRRAHTAYWMNRQHQLQDCFNKSNVDHVSVATNEDYVKQLLMLFKMRNKGRI